MARQVAIRVRGKIVQSRLPRGGGHAASSGTVSTPVRVRAVEPVDEPAAPPPAAEALPLELPAPDPTIEIAHLLARCRALEEALALPTLRWEDIYRGSGWELRTVVGVMRYDTLWSEQRAGFLAFGPYVALGIGRYRAVLGFDDHQGTGPVEIEVCHAGGSVPLLTEVLRVEDLQPAHSLHFSVLDAVTGVEVRVLVPDTANVALGSLLIQKLG